MTSARKSQKEQTGQWEGWRWPQAWGFPLPAATPTRPLSGDPGSVSLEIPGQ